MNLKTKAESAYDSDHRATWGRNNNPERNVIAILSNLRPIRPPLRQYTNFLQICVYLSTCTEERTKERRQHQSVTREQQSRFEESSHTCCFYLLIVGWEDAPLAVSLTLTLRSSKLQRFKVVENFDENASRKKKKVMDVRGGGGHNIVDHIIQSMIQHKFRRIS